VVVRARRIVEEKRHAREGGGRKVTYRTAAGTPRCKDRLCSWLGRREGWCGVAWSCILPDYTVRVLEEIAGMKATPHEKESGIFPAWTCFGSDLFSGQCPTIDVQA
jgi:hypothetical protein